MLLPCWLHPCSPSHCVYTVKAFYKGITPRVARVAPGQAVVFAVCK